MKGKLHHREMNHIPVRFLIAIVLAVLETAAVIAAVMVCSYYIPYFYLLVWATEIAVVIQIIASDDNPDYRSLVHHFENGIWMYRCKCLKDMKADFADTLEKCIRIDESKTNWTLPQRFLRAVLKVFAPLL